MQVVFGCTDDFGGRGVSVTDPLDLDAIRTEHYRGHKWYDGHACGLCGAMWPCTTHALCDELESTRAERDRQQEGWTAADEAFDRFLDDYVTAVGVEWDDDLTPESVLEHVKFTAAELAAAHTRIEELERERDEWCERAIDGGWL